MGDSLKITVTGPPISKKRPRFARIGKGVRTYNCQETEEGRWLWEAQQQITEKMEGPLRVKMIFAMPRPKAHFGTGKNANRLKDSAPYYHTSKPDLDNMEKFVKDCLNGVAWRDDSQVCELESKKKYDYHPRTEIIIERVL